MTSPRIRTIIGASEGLVPDLKKGRAVDGVTLSPSAEGVVEHDLSGFFVGWPDPPSLVRRLAILQSASVAWRTYARLAD